MEMGSRKCIGKARAGTIDRGQRLFFVKKLAGGDFFLKGRKGAKIFLLQI